MSESKDFLRTIVEEDLKSGKNKEKIGRASCRERVSSPV